MLDLPLHPVRCGHTELRLIQIPFDGNNCIRVGATVAQQPVQARARAPPDEHVNGFASLGQQGRYVPADESRRTGDKVPHEQHTLRKLLPAGIVANRSSQRGAVGSDFEYAYH